MRRVAKLLAAACLTFLTCGIAGAAAGQKIDVVWDGFSFPNESGAAEACDVKRNPSCKLLFSDDYQAHFFKKIQEIEDDRYQFVNYAADERGETLHLTITINLEWAEMADLSEVRSLKPDSYVGRYRLCSSLMLYRADSSRYMLENVKAMCATKELLAREHDNLDGFIEKFIRGRASATDTNVESDWLAEAAQLLVKKSGFHVPLGVANVELSDQIYAGDSAKRERLRLFLAEDMSYRLSEAFKKPVIPPTLSANGQKSLRFSDPSRNRSISIWPAAHTISLTILPFQQKLIDDNEHFFSMLTLSHESATKERHLSNAGFFFGRKIPVRRTTSSTNNTEARLILDLQKRQIPVENLDRLFQSIAAQLVKTEKKWIEENIYKSDPAAVLRGFAKLQKELQ